MGAPRGKQPTFYLSSELLCVYIYTYACAISIIYIYIYIYNCLDMYIHTDPELCSCICANICVNIHKCLNIDQPEVCFVVVLRPSNT